MLLETVCEWTGLLAEAERILGGSWSSARLSKNRKRAPENSCAKTYLTYPLEERYLSGQYQRRNLDEWLSGKSGLGIVKVTSMAHMTHNSFVHFIFGGTFLLLFIDAP